MAMSIHKELKKARTQINAVLFKLLAQSPHSIQPCVQTPPRHPICGVCMSSLCLYVSRQAGLVKLRLPVDVTVVVCQYKSVCGINLSSVDTWARLQASCRTEKNTKSLGLRYWNKPMLWVAICLTLELAMALSVQSVGEPLGSRAHTFAMVQQSALIKITKTYVWPTKQRRLKS